MTVEQNQSKLGLYVHIPFCEKKCFYCDFYSIESHSQRAEFITSLIKEIELFSETNPRLMADTIFFGGGTPSLLTPQELERILDSLHRSFDISSDTEFTMECNPGAVDIQHLSDYRQIGANRLSFGVQSFFDDELKFLQRIHNSQEAVTAVDAARNAGFENINVDLIYALPNQTLERLLVNLERGVDLNPTHISAYALIVEPGTPLFSVVAKGEVRPTEDDTEAAMYETVMTSLQDKGYTHYEVSNYSRPGFQCRHNLKYWNGDGYIGFGPSAHSHLDNTRWWNVSSLNAYIASLADNKMPVAAKEELNPSQITDEYVFLYLRQGRLDLNALLTKRGISLDPGFISDMSKAGYWEIFGDELRLTAKGFTVCDEIAEEILAAHSIST